MATSNFIVALTIPTFRIEFNHFSPLEYTQLAHILVHSTELIVPESILTYEN